MNINEEQNRAKLIKLRKRHLIVKQHFYKSFGIQYRLHLHFYLLWKDRIACALKTWRSWINVRNASFFFSHAIGREATTRLWAKSELIIECSSLLTKGDIGVNNIRNRKTEEKIIQNRQKIRPKPKTSLTLKIGKPKNHIG